MVLALIAATAVQQRIGSQFGGYFPVILPIWAMDVGFLLILAGYVAGLLILTSRRVQFTRRILATALGTGALTAGVLYPLAPFGINDAAETAAHSLHGGPVVVVDYLVLACFVLAALAVPVAVHAAATRLAGRDTRPGILSPARQALLATAGAMATAAILVALFTTLTIALIAAPLHRAATSRRRWHLPHLRAEHHRHPGEPARRVLLRGPRQRGRRRGHRVADRAARRRRPGRAARSPPLPTGRHPARGPPRGSVTDPFVQRTAGTDNQGVRRQPRDRVQLPAHGGRRGVGGSQPGVSVSPPAG